MRTSPVIITLVVQHGLRLGGLFDYILFVDCFNLDFLHLIIYTTATNNKHEQTPSDHFGALIETLIHALFDVHPFIRGVSPRPSLYGLFGIQQGY